MNFDIVLLDLESQRDFFLPSGSYYTREAESARKNLYTLFEWARKNAQPVISTVLRVAPNHQGPMGPKPHCLEDTDGEKKLSRTLIRPYIDLGLQNSTDLPANLFETYRQVIFEKRNTDIFAHARIERLMTEMSNICFVLCGAGVAQGLVEAAIGLRMRGFGVVIAKDAVVDLNDPHANFAYERMNAKGCVFAKTKDIVAPATRAGQTPFAQFADNERFQFKKSRNHQSA